MATFNKRVKPKLAERDGGWFCHYCKIQLVPVGTPVTDERYFHRVRVRNYEKRYSYKLVYQPLPEYDFPEVDHKLCKAKGGTNDLDNLVLCCGLCNYSKATRDYDEFVAWMQSEEQS